MFNYKHVFHKLMIYPIPLTAKWTMKESTAQHNVSKFWRFAERASQYIYLSN